MKKVFVLFIVLSFVSCKNTNNNTTTNEIIAFIIDKKAWPLPPPPPIDDTTTTEISKKMLDSLFKIKLKVAVYPTLNNFSEKEMKIIPEKYSTEFDLKNNSQNKITFNEFFSQKGHKIIVADTIEMKKYKDFQSFDLLFWFSNFYYSKDNQKILFSLGISRSRLAGSSALYVLKKEENTWVTEYFKNLAIW
jgi:hypothetical protein